MFRIQIRNVIGEWFNTIETFNSADEARDNFISTKREYGLTLPREWRVVCDREQVGPKAV